MLGTPRKRKGLDAKLWRKPHHLYQPRQFLGPYRLAVCTVPTPGTKFSAMGLQKDTMWRRNRRQASRILIKTIQSNTSHCFFQNASLLGDPHTYIENQVKGACGIRQVTPKAPAESPRDPIRSDCKQLCKVNIARVLVRQPKINSSQAAKGLPEPRHTGPNGIGRTRDCQPHRTLVPGPRTGATGMPIFKHEPRRGPCDSATGGAWLALPSIRLLRPDANLASLLLGSMETPTTWRLEVQALRRQPSRA